MITKLPRLACHIRGQLPHGMDPVVLRNLNRYSTHAWEPDATLTCFGVTEGRRASVVLIWA